ncbi:TonB-dependent receptor domain-containing protein [Pseudoalteromonas sp. 68 DY56-GL68]|uniref:TonB-dependent receptor domain-containing protein n=1 Tax=Pseudoalteromonas sp. 68 DY56-GL68 TaxID=2974919 RepID=UPI00352B2B44
MIKNEKNPRPLFVYSAIAMAMMGGVSVNAVAQDEGVEKVERIEVTGSRIKRADVEGASPVTSIGRVAIESSGVQNIGELLQTVAQADLSGLTQLTNNTNGNDGSQTISLRNLGDNRTLVLVDGRRFLALGGGQVDISQIPIAIVERVDILTDGASAVYGSDAISGVVNIITKNGFEGVSLDVTVGANLEGDGEHKQAGISIGTIKDKTSLFLNISKSEEKEISAGDRDISQYPVAHIPAERGSAFGLFGIFNTSDGFVSLNPDREGPGLRTAADFEPFGTKHRYNFAPTNYLKTPSDRFNVFAKVNHEFSDELRGFIDFTYNQRKSVTQIAAVPLTAGFAGPQWEIPFSKDSIYNPFGEDLSSFGFRTLPIGPRTSIQDYDTYFITGGFEGEFEFADRSFIWDVSMSRGDSSRNEHGENFVNLQNLRNAVGPSFIEGGIAQCGTPDNVIAGCVPLNIFNGETGFTEEMARYIGYEFNEQVRTGATNFAANISGDLFELPAGWLAFAAGVERRVNTFSDSPDSLVAAGLSSNNFREPTSGKQTAEEAYFEFVVPVLADLPGVERLEVSVAGRFSDFENSGLVGTQSVDSDFDNESFKVGFTWRVYEDLMLRGNYADTFRAPSINNLFAGGGEGFPSVQDPCNTTQFGLQSAATQARCMADNVPSGGSIQPTGQLRELNGGNVNLQPEEGNTVTFGFVYNPSWLEGFDISVDYYKIELEEALSTLDAGDMLTRCYVQNDENFCGFVERREDGRVETVRTSQFNLAQLEVEGYDFNANYRFDTHDFGSFAMRLTGSYTDKYRFAGEDERISDVDNQVAAIDSDILRWRGTFNTTWTYNDLSVTWGMRYTSDITESCSIPEDFVERGIATRELCNQRGRTSEDNPNGLNHVGSVTYHDLSASYALPWQASVRVGMRNIFRKDPPVALNPFANSFYSVHDIPGGTWFMNYKQDF